MKVAESAAEDYNRIKTPLLERRVLHVLSEHPTDGPGVYKNVRARAPFDGDYILEVFSDGNVSRVWYVVDEQEKLAIIVRAWSEPFRWM